MIAAVVLAASHHVSMIVIGRIFQGIAVSLVGFAHTLTVTVHVIYSVCNSLQFVAFRWHGLCW